MSSSRRLRAATVAACAGYHVIVAHIIFRIAVTDITAAAQAVLTWLKVHVVVLGWMFGSVGYHATIKGVELSCELDYAISFWSWILS